MHDVVIVGAGPAGCSAAWECCSAGLQVLLVSSSLDTVFMADGASVDLDPGSSSFTATLGLSGETPARQAHRQAKWLLEQQPGLHLLEASVADILVTDGRVSGVSTWEGPAFTAPLVGLCVGSFLAATLQSGALTEQAGKPGQMSYPELADSLVDAGVELERTVRSFQSAAGPGTVTCSFIAASELEAGLWLHRLPGLAAAGFCVQPGVDFRQALWSGQELGRALVAQARAVSSTGRT